MWLKNLGQLLVTRIDNFDIPLMLAHCFPTLKTTGLDPERNQCSMSAQSNLFASSKCWLMASCSKVSSSMHSCLTLGRELVVAAEDTKQGLVTNSILFC